MTVAASLTDSAGPPVASDATAGGETAVTAGSGSYGGSRKDHESTAVIPAGASARISMSGASVRNAGLSSKDLCLLRLLAGSMFFDQFNVSSIAPLLPSFAKLFHLPETSSTLLLAGRSTAAILFALPACPLLSSVTTLCGLTGVCTQLVRAGALSFATHAHSPSASAASASASASPSPLSGEIRRKDQAKEGARKELPQVLPGEDGALSPHPSDLVPALDPAPLALGGESASSAEASPRTGKSRAPIETAAAEAPGKAAAEAPKTAAAALGGRELLFGAVAMLFAWAAVGSVAGPVTMTFLFQFGSPSLPFLFSLGIDLFLLFLLLIILPCCCGGRRRTKVVDVESSAPDGTVAGGTATGASAPITDSLPTWQLQVSEQERPVVYRGAPIFAIPSRGAPLNRSTSLTRSTSNSYSTTRNRNRNRATQTRKSQPSITASPTLTTRING
ncbi:hypothetical protein CLOM_g11562 [Closterium sp. NIES-68]|nr:hypothetical protein CLOM_g11562 [Closterium sp. NIES-68]